MNLIERGQKYYKLIQDIYNLYESNNINKPIPNYQDFIKYAFKVYTNNKNNVTYDINYIDEYDLIKTIMIILINDYHIDNPIKEFSYIIIRYAENN